MAKYTLHPNSIYQPGLKTRYRASGCGHLVVHPDTKRCRECIRNSPKIVSSIHGYLCYSAGTGNRRYVHRDIAEKALGRPLKKGECVHHIDLNTLNNRNDNLLICTTSYHKWLHHAMERAWVKEHILKENSNACN